MPAKLSSAVGGEVQVDAARGDGKEGKEGTSQSDLGADSTDGTGQCRRCGVDGNDPSSDACLCWDGHRDSRRPDTAETDDDLRILDQLSRVADEEVTPPWAVLWPALRKLGWSWADGEPEPFWYLAPGTTQLDGVFGVNMFREEKEVEEYVRAHGMLDAVSGGEIYSI